MIVVSVLNDDICDNITISVAIHLFPAGLALAPFVYGGGGILKQKGVYAERGFFCIIKLQHKPNSFVYYFA